MSHDQLSAMLMFTISGNIHVLCASFRYITGSTKEVTRWKREKGASRVFRLKETSRLPARSLLFSVTTNKVQVINMIIQNLIEHKDDPVTPTLIVTGPDPVPLELPGPHVNRDTGEVICRHDLRTTQEEADTIIVQQVVSYFCKFIVTCTCHCKVI